MSDPPVLRGRLGSRDAWWLLVLVGLAAIYAWRWGNLTVLPAEDAAILMRYARHVAAGHGIVWNIGEPPVDGATDFLFMVVVAGLIRMGASAELAVRALTFGAWFGMLGMTFLGSRALFGASRWAAAMSCGFLITGPALNYIEAMFGTPAFGFWAGATWLLAIVTSRRGGWSDAFAFAVSGLILGLTRPEGVFLAAFMLLSIRILSPRGCARQLISFACVLGLVGGAYFFWHWSYFGYPLPNPFYRKAHGALSLDALGMPVRNVVVLLNGLLLGFLVALGRESSRREACAVAVPVLGFTALWILLSNEMNYRMRFQFGVVPMVVLSLPGLVERGWRTELAALVSPKPRSAIVLLGVICFGVILGQALVYRCFRPTTADGRYRVALRLSALADRGYVMATSEAGLLPLYSRWRSIDTWGLNDVTIAHAKRLTAEYLDRHQPHLIVFHADFEPTYRPEGRPTDGWKEMCLILRDYAIERRYRLAALWGRSAGDFHYYYVRSDFEDTGRVAGLVSTQPYEWWLDGTPAFNHASRWGARRFCEPGGFRGPGALSGGEEAPGRSRREGAQSIASRRSRSAAWGWVGPRKRMQRGVAQRRAIARRYPLRTFAGGASIGLEGRR